MTTISVYILDEREKSLLIEGLDLSLIVYMQGELVQKMFLGSRIYNLVSIRYMLIQA